ncbi:MAG: aromatic ring-hydroxylating dioxygenase subunit alpha [bacterium]|nr:(2Fe-2S)-binding protein [Deltaproteobacteria bacterium]MCP4907009.1 aromatic ring-hydroxylating dioxygenase subunit alpha [bacterium]
MTRCPGPSYQDIIDGDRAAPPAILRESAAAPLGAHDLPVDVYLSAEYHRREVEGLWRKVWQIAGRVEDVANPGDSFVYDIADDSLIILRTRTGELRAYHNACLHRGTRLRDEDGSLERIRCPYHGFIWSLEGDLSEIPCRWDFPQVENDDFRLPEARVDTWGGFVFVHFDPEAEPLEAYLEDLPRHFRHWPLEDRFVAARVERRVACNWKIAIEAFIETYHIIGVHPGNLPFFGDANSQYDVWPDQRHHNRMLNASGIPSPHVRNEISDQRVIDMAVRFGMLEPGTRIPEGATTRSLMVEASRKRIAEAMGVDTGSVSDAEIQDVIQYSLFPNIVLFGGLGSPLFYRARPDGNDPNSCLFEVMILQPVPVGAERPTPAKRRWLEEHEKWSDVPELSYFGPVLDEDQEVMPQVQRGLRASRKPSISLSVYQESRIRHFRRTLEEYVPLAGSD